MLLVPPALHRHGTSLINTIRNLGLTSGLQVCLDAGDANSYSSGQVWGDLSGNGYDFNRGTGSGSDGADPTFNGTAGRQSSGEYWSGDGGDYFTYDSAIETWMQSLGKSGQSVSVFAHAYIAADTDATIFGTNSDTASAGASFGYVASFNKMVFTVQQTDAQFGNFGGVGPDLTGLMPKVFAVGFAATLTNGQGYTVHVDGTNYAGTIGTDIVSTNPPNNMKIMARGDASRIFPSGARLFDLAIWSSKLADADIVALHNATKGRYGL